MTDPRSPDDLRRRYEDVLLEAMVHAERYLARDQALEIAHGVASDLLRLPPNRVTGALVYVTVTRRLRSLWRAKERRAALESAYHDVWSRATRAWENPAAAMEIDELHVRIQTALDDMPHGMRDVFLLIREEELSYKETAARLGIAVSTVHTQISRASALLRSVVADYHAGKPVKRTRKAEAQ